MTFAIEAVIIFIVVVSFTVLGAIVFALYWLWRLLLEDRRFTRLNSPLEWPRRSSVTRLPTLSSEAVHVFSEAEPLTSTPRCGSFPRITRDSNVIVDERDLQMHRAKRPVLQQERSAVGEVLPDVVMLDDNEPPPPYEAG